MTVPKTENPGIVPEKFMLGSVLASLNGAEYIVCGLRLHGADKTGLGPNCLTISLTEKEQLIEKVTWGRKPEEVEKLEEQYAQQWRPDIAASFAKHGSDILIDENSFRLSVDLTSQEAEIPDFYKYLKPAGLISDYFPELEDDLRVARNELALGSSVSIKLSTGMVDRYVVSQIFQAHLNADHQMEIETYAHLGASDYFSSSYFMRLHEEAMQSGRCYQYESGFTTSSELKVSQPQCAWLTVCEEQKSRKH